MKIITMELFEKKKSWDFHMRYALLVYRMSKNGFAGKAHFLLVYGIEVVMLTQQEFPSMKMQQYLIVEPDNIKRSEKNLYI